MPDAIFAHPRLAEIYDTFDGDRSDLDAYVAIAAELSAGPVATIVDVGCGTGNLAVRLAALGHRVVGVDLPYVSFRGSYRFPDGTVIGSQSTLRFRERDELEASLAECGFDVVDVREAPDRMGKEFVFIARRRDHR